MAKQPKRDFGTIEELPSGRFRARYSVPGDVAKKRVWVNAKRPFTSILDARAWLRREEGRLEQEAAGAPRRPKASRGSTTTLSTFAKAWIDERKITPATERVYRIYLDKHILPALGEQTLEAITVDVVKAWYGALLPGRPTLRARSYALLRTIMNNALDEGLIPTNPARIRGASQAKPKAEVVVATPAQVADLTAAMPERLRLSVLLGAWCQLRNGECLELRRRDVDLKLGAVRIRRGVTWIDGEPVVGDPKTAAGVRLVHLPPHIIEAVKAHLTAYANAGRDGLLFPAQPGVNRQMNQTTYASWYFKEAVKKTDLPDSFRYHWLRHTGLTLASQSGATIAELQARAGHSTPNAAMRYQHASADRDRVLAQTLSDLATATAGGNPGA